MPDNLLTLFFRKFFFVTPSECLFTLTEQRGPIIQHSRALTKRPISDHPTLLSCTNTIIAFKNHNQIFNPQNVVLGVGQLAAPLHFIFPGPQSPIEVFQATASIFNLILATLGSYANKSPRKIKRWQHLNPGRTLKPQPNQYQSITHFHSP